MKITNYQMLYDNILVEAIEIEEVDGVIRANSYDDKPEEGVVVSVGHGRVFESGEVVPLQIKEKDRVLFNKYSSTKFNLEGKEYFVVREEDIVGYAREKGD